MFHHRDTEGTEGTEKSFYFVMLAHTAMDGRQYDYKDGIGRIESGTETENNAGAIVEASIHLSGEYGTSGLMPICAMDTG